jgi:uncharacterized protein YlxP (DUF503 family)
MIVGAALVELHVHGSRSLKAKRGVVRSIVSRVRSRFNVSVAEVGGQDTWQRAVLGLSVSGSERVRVRQTLDRVLAFIDSLHLAEIRGSDVEILDLPQEEPGDEGGCDGEFGPEVCSGSGQWEEG